METYGEDPYLTGRMAVQFVKGTAGRRSEVPEDGRHGQALRRAQRSGVACATPSTPWSSDRDLLRHLPAAFEAAVREGGAYSVMCAYNRVDGVPACASPRLLEKILRNQWGFDGLRGLRLRRHRRHLSEPQDVCRAPEAGVAARGQAPGTDLNCGVEYAAVCCRRSGRA